MPPMGDCHLKIEKAFLAESKVVSLDKRLQVEFTMSIAAGNGAGRKVFKSIGIEGPHKDVGLSILHGDLQVLGLKMKNIANLVGKKGILQKTVGKIVAARLVQNKDPRFYSCYFNDIVEEMPEEDELEAEEEDEIEEEELEEDKEKDTAKEEEGEEEEEETEEEGEESEEAEEDDDPDNWALSDIETA